MTPATTTMVITRLVRARRRRWRSRAAIFASRAARLRARLSVGTARHPIGRRSPRSLACGSGCDGAGPGGAGPGPGPGRPERRRSRRRSTASFDCVALVVQKFGGTSVSDAERVRAVADHVARTRRQGADVVVVVSAMGKTTDDLLRLAGDVSTVQPLTRARHAPDLGRAGVDGPAVHGAGRARASTPCPSPAARRASSPTPRISTPRSSRSRRTGCAPRWTRDGSPWWPGSRGCRSIGT